MGDHSLIGSTTALDPNAVGSVGTKQRGAGF